MGIFTKSGTVIGLVPSVMNVHTPNAAKTRTTTVISARTVARRSAFFS